ncbi:MAG: Gfo/Idh/MocA family protein [Anaerolineae bacterium]
MGKLRAAIIGTGNIANSHMLGYRTLPEVEVVAGADVLPGRAEAFGAKWQIPQALGDWRSMLEQVRPDIVSVCTWEEFHADLVCGAAERGARGILCEKPMAMNLGEADRMLAACDKTGTKLAIGHMRRYNPHYLEAKRLIDSGAVGQVESMWSLVAGWDMFLWGVHYADMLHMLNGDGSLRWVMGQVDWRQRGMSYPYSQHWLKVRGDAYYLEDNASALMEFDNGVRAIWESGMHSPQLYQRSDGGHGRCEIRISGTEGEICVSDSFIRRRGRGEAEWTRTSWRDGMDPKAFDAAMFGGELGELAHCIVSGAEHQLNGRRGRKALELLMAIYESARLRAPVEIPLQQTANPLKLMIDSGQLG